MSHIHYKFSSKLSYDTVVFDEPHITLRDLKRQIMGRERLKAGDSDLQITNAQSKEEYTDDDATIPKGSSVIVRRVPANVAKSRSSGNTHNIEHSNVHFFHNFGAFKTKMDYVSSTGSSPFLSKMANLSNMDVSEDDKIHAIQSQSTESMNYNKKHSVGLPVNYTCYRCGTMGHHIRSCPSSGQERNFEPPLRIKKSTGIPRSFMVEVDDPSIKGAMLTNCGRYAIPAIDAEAYAAGKKEKPPFMQQESKSEDEEVPIPDILLCLLCHDLLNDAVVIPCCGNSYCDDCIRSALLDSEDHICPTCNQSDVSPDTLIANKFLRQAVNNFKKEQGDTKLFRRTSCTSQSQTPTPSPVPTPPPLHSESQPQQKSQQESLPHCLEATDTPPVSQESGTPPIVTGSVSTLNTSPHLEEGHSDLPDKEADGETLSAPAGSPSAPVSNTVFDTPSQLIPLVPHTPVKKERQCVSINEEQCSSADMQPDLLSNFESNDPASAHSAQTAWESSSSSVSVCPGGGWTKFSTQQLPSFSSTYPATLSPLYPRSQLHMFHPAQQPLSSYPPGYPPTTPLWTLPTPQGTPIPPLCSSSSTSSISALIPKDWFTHQKHKKERSPHRGPTHRQSSHSHSKSSKNKSSSSYFHHSSRSHSRSQSRSRPHSPYVSQRDIPSHHHSSQSYSHGYKISCSPTPSSSSSSRVHPRSRSKSPSDNQKNHHRRHHHSKRSSLRSSSSRTRANHSSASRSSRREDRDWSLDTYLQWKREYQEWCDKYFTNYIGHFHQLPPPLLTPPPPPQLHGGNNLNSHFDSSRSSQMDGYSSPSQSSSDSCSPPSQSVSESNSVLSQFSSDSHSTPSQMSSDSHSPPSQSYSDSCSKPSQERAQPGANTSTRDRKEVELQERSKGDKQLITKKLKDRRQSIGRAASPEHGSVWDETTSDASQLLQFPLKPDQHFDDGYERKSKEDKTVDKETGLKKGKYFDSKLDVKKHYKIKQSQEADSVDSDKNRSGKAPDSKLEKRRKRKAEDIERNERERILTDDVHGENLLTNLTESPQTHVGESPQRFDREKQKKAFWCAQPVSKEDLWEKGIKVRPQKKISININLDGKRKGATAEKQFYSETKEGKSQEMIQDIHQVAEETNRLETDNSVNEKDGQTSRDEKNETRESFVGKEDGDEEEESDLWHCALKGVEVLGKREEKRIKEQQGNARKNRRQQRKKEELLLTRQTEWAKEDARRQERKSTEDTTSQWKSNNQDRTKTTVDNSSSTVGSVGGMTCEDHQQRWTVVKGLEETNKNKAAEKLDELIQVPLSKWEKEDSEEEEQVNPEGKVQTDSFLSPRPPTLLTSFNRATKGENDSKRQKLVETDGDRGRAKDKREDGERTSNSSLNRNLAPSSGKDKTDSPFSVRKGKEKTMEDREERRERESSGKRQKESKRSREKMREEVRRRDQERESTSSSIVTKHSSFSTHYFTHIIEDARMKRSFEAVRKEMHQEGKKSREKSSGCFGAGGSRERYLIGRATELVSQNIHITHRGTEQEFQWKDESKHHLDYYLAVSQHPPRYSHSHFHSHSQSRETVLLPWKTSRESSPDRESSQSRFPDFESHRTQHLSSQDLGLEREDKKKGRRRSESREERGEWDSRKVSKSSKQERQPGHSEAKRLSTNSSISSSARKEQGQNTHEKEKRCTTLELEDTEQITYTRKKTKQRREEKSCGDADDRWEEEDETKDC